MGCVCAGGGVCSKTVDQWLGTAATSSKRRKRFVFTDALVVF